MVLAGSLFWEVDGFSPSFRPRTMSSRRCLLKKLHEHETIISSLRNLNQDDDSTTDGTFGSKVLTNVQASTSMTNPKALEVTSWSFFFVGVSVALACLAIFTGLQHQINDTAVANGFQGNLQDLTIFDLRSGYPHETVNNVLSAWGQQGRLLYLLVQAVDIFIYHPAYRGASLVLLNQLMTSFVTRFPSLSFLRKAALFPIFLAMVDFYEDVGQILFTMWYQLQGELLTMSSSYWQSVVMVSSLINQTKWTLVRGGAVTSSVLLLCVVGHMIGQKVWRQNDNNDDIKR